MKISKEGENPNFELENFPTISSAEIIEEAKAAIKSNEELFKTQSHEKVLEQLLHKIPNVDFMAKVYPESVKIREELKILKAKRSEGVASVDGVAEKKHLNNEEGEEGLERQIAKKKQELEKFKLTKKHYKIICIEVVLNLAKQYRWGLCKRHDFIYIFNSEFWQLLEESDLATFLGKAAVKMGVNKWDADDESFVCILLKQFMYKAHLPEPKRQDDIALINLKNGTFQVDQNGGELKPFNRQDFITYQLPFDYNINATSPIFQKYLNTVLPEKASQDVLSEYLGYVFTRHLKLEKTLLLYGSGANGKSVFFEIVNALLGSDNVTSYSLQSLTNESGYYRAKLANTLVNYASEINGKLETSIFKQLVSGEPVEARLPYGNPFTMKHYGRLIFNCNELPREVEHTNAYFRRFMIIPFSVTIVEHEQDKELANKIIKNELSGVFNWVLEGLDRLLKQKKFTKSPASEDLLKQYRKESDSVQMFLDDEGYEKSTGDHKPLKEIYVQYKMYCNESGFINGSLRTFSKRLKAIGFITTRQKYGNALFIQKKNFVLEPTLSTPPTPQRGGLV